MKKSRVWSWRRSFSHWRSISVCLRFEEETLQRLVEGADRLPLRDAFEALETDEVGLRRRGECLRQVCLARSRRTFYQNRLLHLGREPDDLHQYGIGGVAGFAEPGCDVLRCREH